MTDIHSCSYYCDRPECVRRQRDEMRGLMEAQKTPAEAQPVGYLSKGTQDGEEAIGFRAGPGYRAYALPDGDTPLYAHPPQSAPGPSAAANEADLVEAAALLMREKIAQCVEMNPRKVALEFAARIREEITPVTLEQVRKFSTSSAARKGGES